MKLKFFTFLKIQYQTANFWIRKNWKVSSCILLMFILLIYSVFFKIRLASDNMPYSCHTDEKYIVEPALRILKSGDFNPHRFNYPSLPIYFAAISFTVGYLNAAENLELKSTKDIVPDFYPYFKHPRIIWPAKVLFILFSAFSVLFMALIAYRLYENPIFLIGVPLVASLSYKYFIISSIYINVDTMATFFVFLLYLYLTLTLKKDSFLHRAVLPGILSGLVIACKYNLFWIIVPSILIILFYSKKRRIVKIISLVLTMFCTFFMVVPFSLLDFSTFLDWLGFVIYYYKKGTPNITTPQGIPQFFYHLDYLLNDFGYLLSILAIIGLIAVLMKNWKKGLILLSFPLLLLFQVSSFSRHYPRNILSLFIFFAFFSVMGMIWLYRHLSSLSVKLLPSRGSQGIKKGIVIFLLSFVLCFPAIENLKKQMEINPDSRKRTIDWIVKNVVKKRNLIVSRELGIYVEPLIKDYNVFLWKFTKYNKKTFVKKIREVENPIIIMPVFCTYFEYHLAARKRANALNKIGESLKLMEKFGWKKIIIDNPNRITHSNPKVLIGTL